MSKFQDLVNQKKGYWKKKILDGLRKREEDEPKMGWKRGVFVLTEKLTSGLSQYLSFSFPTNKKMLGIPIGGLIELSIFNEMMFANWFLVEWMKDKKFLSDHQDFLISEITNQEQWNSLCSEMSSSNIVTAVLNPCISKNHQCPVYRFNFKDEINFNNLKEWFSKCPNNHYTINIGDGALKAESLVLLKKPIMGDNNTFDFRS